MLPRITPWPPKGPVLLYAIGTNITKGDKGSRMIKAYFLNQPTEEDPSPKLFPVSLSLGLLPLLKPGYCYEDGRIIGPVLGWCGKYIQTQTFSFQNLRAGTPAFQQPFRSKYTNQENPEMFHSLYFHCLDDSPAPKNYFISPSEIVRAFFAINTDILNLLFSEKDIDTYVSCHLSGDGYKLTLSEDCLECLKKDSVVPWLYWLLSSDSAYAKWKSVKTAYQTYQTFEAELPLPMSGTMHCRMMPFEDSFIILSIEKYSLDLPSDKLEVSLTKHHAIRQSAASSSKSTSVNSSSICGDNTSAHYGTETKIEVPSEFSIGKSLNIRKTFRPSDASGRAKSHFPAAHTGVKLPISLQEPLPNGTNPPGNLMGKSKDSADKSTSSTMSPPEEGKPGFEKFQEVLRQLPPSIYDPNVHMQYYEFPDGNSLSNITPSGEMTSRRKYAVYPFDYRGNSFAILEIDTRDGKRISTLLFPCKSDAIEATSLEYINELCGNGNQWNRESLLKKHADLVRHCKNQVDALQRHIQALLD